MSKTFSEKHFLVFRQGRVSEMRTFVDGSEDKKKEGGGKVTDSE